MFGILGFVRSMLAPKITTTAMAAPARPEPQRPLQPRPVDNYTGPRCKDCIAWRARVYGEAMGEWIGSRLMTPVAENKAESDYCLQVVVKE